MRCLPSNKLAQACETVKANLKTLQIFLRKENKMNDRQVQINPIACQKTYYKPA